MVSRKAAVVAAVRDSRITMAEALHRYQLTEEGFRSWQRAFERHSLLACGQPAFSNIVKRACCSHRENRARITTRFRRHQTRSANDDRAL